MARPVAKLLTGFFIVAALLLAVVLVLTLSQPAAPPPPMPNPNGYEDLARAGAMISNLQYRPRMSLPELQAATARNGDALKLAKLGLSRECRVPLDPSPTNSARLERLADIKRLARALAATGSIAELENRPGDAAEAYLTVIQLGGAVSRGGLLIDSLVGIAVESVGMRPLQKLGPTLDATQCRTTAAALEACENQREPMDTVRARERAWASRTYGLSGRIARLFAFRSLTRTEQGVTAKVQAQAKQARSLLIKLAARAYELEKGEGPKTIADLVPVYLKAIPLDPQTETNMAYAP